MSQSDREKEKKQMYTSVEFKMISRKNNGNEYEDQWIIGVVLIKIKNQI